MDTFLKLRHTDNHEYYGIKTVKITQKQYIHYILNYMMEKKNCRVKNFPLRRIMRART